ncbi:hypothetical protein B0H17DRAFT_1209852 [Mycena rosella]|uniref:Uncharacterized protein n=1 Tax=Mycena rosella TaxID=1033263 RepID=A0AAD7G818_MYCRO|nr:hypothetical protein B0H17DRAFT_1209852 [Mycena rosella]
MHICVLPATRTTHADARHHNSTTRPPLRAIAPRSGPQNHRSHFATVRDAELCNGNNKIPKPSEVLEIMEQRHYWAKLVMHRLEVIVLAEPASSAIHDHDCTNPLARLRGQLTQLILRAKNGSESPLRCVFTVSAKSRTARVSARGLRWRRGSGTRMTVFSCPRMAVALTAGRGLFMKKRRADTLPSRNKDTTPRQHRVDNTGPARPCPDTGSTLEAPSPPTPPSPSSNHAAPPTTTPTTIRKHARTPLLTTAGTTSKARHTLGITSTIRPVIILNPLFRPTTAASAPIRPSVFERSDCTARQQQVCLAERLVSTPGTSISD